MKRIKKGDEVVVIAGRSKGLTGQVLSVLENDRLIVEGVNMVKRHRKPNRAAGEAKGNIDNVEASIHASNVMLYNPMSRTGDRVGFKILEDGRKVRIFRSTGEAVDI